MVSTAKRNSWLRIARAIAVATLAGGARASAAQCTPVRVYENGYVETVVCAEEPGSRRVLLDLRDEWAPRIFSDTPEQPLPYRATFVALANERIGEGGEWERARYDRHFELFGIFPSFSVIRGRLLDVERHACHASVDDSALRALKRTLSPWDPKPSKPRSLVEAARRSSISALQRHLACEQLLPPGAREGSFDVASTEALAAYQRRHMLSSLPVLDAETRETLLTDSRELDYRTLLRALRERVIDATGLLEDGSASNAWEPVLARHIESAEYRRAMRDQGLPRGAPDLVARATSAAAQALGWTSPQRASAALENVPYERVALELPQRPAYYAGQLTMRAEIDRGDVWLEYPFDAQRQPRPSPVRNRPTLTLFVQTSDGEVPLVRWPTTIGGWKKEKVSGGWEVLRYKPSPTGRFAWRDLLVAPAWFPPPSTPDRELVRRAPDGRWFADSDAVGPGYASAYGLMALLHHRVSPGGGGSLLLVDSAVRSHGSGNYRSILRGSSHGCHRLFNHLALRLGSFLLAHHTAVRRGAGDEPYARVVHWRGRRLELHAASRGYRYELAPPIDVEVLPGHAVHVRRKRPPAPPGPAPGPQASERLLEQDDRAFIDAPASECSG